MNERTRQEIKRFRDAERERERQAEEERQRPIREAEQQMTKTLRELHGAIRERLLTERDSEFKLDPATAAPDPNRKGTISEWQREQSELFRRNNPDYYPCPENESAIVGYINRNAPGIRLVSAWQLTQAYKRLAEFGLLKEHPAPEPAPEPEPEPRSQPEERAPGSEEGYDPSTGERRWYTRYEIAKMSADEFKKAFRLVGEKLPRFVDPRR